MGDVRSYLEGKKELDDVMEMEQSHEMAQNVYEIIERYMLNNERRYDLDMDSMDQTVANSGRIRINFEVAEFDDRMGEVTQFNPFELVLQGTHRGNEPQGSSVPVPVVEADLKVRTSGSNSIVERATFLEVSKNHVVETLEQMLRDYGIDV